MADEDYAILLKKARDERTAAVASRIELNRRIEQLDNLITSLRSIVERPKIDPAKGITEGVKAAVRMAEPIGIFPVMIRAVLQNNGFDFSKQSNPMASIHAILKRLEKKGLVKSHQAKDKTRGVFYRWVEASDVKRLGGESK